MDRTDLLYQQSVTFHCQNKDQARAIKQCVETYGVLPGDISLRVLRALAKHRGTLEMVGKATSKNKAAIMAHLPKIMAFVNDITKG